MEQLLLPLNPTSPLVKVPYVGKERYDGLSFLGYAERKGKLNYGVSSPELFLLEREPRERNNPPGPEEQEPFFQTWLFFGLLYEVFRGNSLEDSQAASDGPNETLDFLYTNFLYEEDGKKYITTARFLPIIEAIVAAPDEERNDVEEIRSRLSHLAICIRYAAAILVTCSDRFNPDIRMSIAAMGESLMWVVSAGLEEQEMEQIAFGAWHRGCFTAQMQAQMFQNGWCPSDIARCKNDMHSIQALHLVSKIDKSQSQTNHSKCTEQFCSAGQIDLTNYEVGHVKENCGCKILDIDSKPVADILDKKDLFPVLRISGGEDTLSNLKVDILESDVSKPFVAISHVWVDGLGNPSANSLYRCQLAQLRNLVQGIKEFAPKGDGEENSVLLWLDTLCCPIGPPSAKQKALSKIRNVYTEACCVLVLDANLRPYFAMQMTVYEILARISTSGWTRRLWTLQEGALAKSLLFQFADQCLSLQVIYAVIQMNYKTLICHRGLQFAVTRETNLIRAFFFPEQYSALPMHLPLLGMALQNRSVTMPMDEPLCISTLLSLDIPVDLSAPTEERMRVMWEHLVASKIGVPAAIIFFTDRRLEIPGFRWAPKTLLGVSQQGINPDERSRMSKMTNAVRLTPYGLHVRFPGFCLRQRSYDDGLPHDPWWGILKDRKTGRPTRILETFLDFRDGENVWFRFCKQETSTNGRVQTSDEEREWKSDMEYPLYDIVATGRCALLFHGGPLWKLSQTEVGLVVSYRDKEIPKHSKIAQELTPALHVRSEGHILVHRCKPNEKLMLSTCERIAIHLRSSDLTRKLCAIDNREGEEYQNVIDELKDDMMRLTKEALDGDPKLVDAVNANHDDFLDHLWKYVANWYRQDVFIAERLPDDQLWIVD